MASAENSTIIEDLNLIIKSNVRKFRLEKGLTQEELAFACDISTTFLAEIELGRRNPSFTTLARLAHALGLQAFQLLIDSTATNERIPKRFIEDLTKCIAEDIADIAKRYG